MKSSREFIKSNINVHFFGSFPGMVLLIALDCEKGGHGQDGEVDEDELDGGGSVDDFLVSDLLGGDSSVVVVEACEQVDEGKVR